MENENKSVFATLNTIDCSEHVEKKKIDRVELSYLSWAWAWAEVKKRYPDASYTVYKDEQKRPYIEDADFGIMCYTTVTIKGETMEMWLPVMDGANKAMRRTPYTYTVRDFRTNTTQNKTVSAATMFDINKTIMRCLVKNLAMFGLGLYIYAGEDLPETDDEPQNKPAVATKEQKQQIAAQAAQNAAKTKANGQIETPVERARKYLAENDAALQHYMAKYPDCGELSHFTERQLREIYDELVKYGYISQKV